MIVSKYLVYTLKTDREHILKTWETRAQEDISQAFDSPLLIKPQLDSFLAILEEALEEEDKDMTIKKVLDYLDQIKVKTKPRYHSLDQIVCEYDLFQEVLIETLSHSLPLKSSESDLLHTVIQEAAQSSSLNRRH